MWVRGDRPVLHWFNCMKNYNQQYRLDLIAPTHHALEQSWHLNKSVSEFPVLRIGNRTPPPPPR